MTREILHEMIDRIPESEMPAAQRALERLAGTAIEPGQPSSMSQNLDDEQPIWEVITDLMKNVPDEVIDQLPKDGASQVDHYIYGLPKRD
jgi:hypothetical protein